MWRGASLAWIGPGVRGFTLVLGLAVAGTGVAVAQDAAQGVAEGPALPVGAVVLMLDQERLFAESRFGAASLERERVAAAALEGENSKIEAALVEEEQALTKRRNEVPAEEFTPLAKAFDAKVERIRGEQAAKIKALSTARDADRQAFLKAVVPVLGKILEDTGAVAILNKSDVVVSANAFDVTNLAIFRVDQVLPEAGPAADAAPLDAPAPVTEAPFSPEPVAPQP
jgi:Skp family chaperone for outer membrane proteins